MNPDSFEDQALQRIALLEEGKEAPPLKSPPIVDMAAPPATEKQMNFIRKLLEEKQHNLPVESYSEEVLDLLDVKAASRIIDLLLKCPNKPLSEGQAAANDPFAEFHGIKEGRYAIVMSSTDADDIGFFQVKYGKHGTWKGRLFIEQLVGGPGDFHRMSVHPNIAKFVLAIIQVDPIEASILFGKKVGVCGVCGSPLTDPISREDGIGPICSGRMQSLYG